MAGFSQARAPWYPSSAHSTAPQLPSGAAGLPPVPTSAGRCWPAPSGVRRPGCRLSAAASTLTPSSTDTAGGAALCTMAPSTSCTRGSALPAAPSTPRGAPGVALVPAAGTRAYSPSASNPSATAPAAGGRGSPLGKKGNGVCGCRPAEVARNAARRWRSARALNARSTCGEMT